MEIMNKKLGHVLIKWRKCWRMVFVFFAMAYFFSFLLSRHMESLFLEQQSLIIRDRNGREIAILPNEKGLYMRRGSALLPIFVEALISKEDQFFYYHPGINPFSILRSVVLFPFIGRIKGSSTLTQQLIKNLFGNENERTVSNKIIESIYALSLELHTKKGGILAMYADTAYFGNRAQGLMEASRTYFNSRLESLTNRQILELLASLSNPNDYPGTARNNKKALALGERLKIPIDKARSKLLEPLPNYNYERGSTALFELSSLGKLCKKSCALTVDYEIINTIREILRTNLDSPSFASAKNGAVAIILLNPEKKENELLAIVGSPHPTSLESGYQINMAVRPRPIGSTAKPFIYMKAFEKGARPYTITEDAEYKFGIGTGFPLYPKNYDGKYRGEVTLHEALANSLNVPAIQVLQYAGLENIYSLLQKDLQFKSLNPLENYKLSIALGGLEMDLLTLSEYFTIFPNYGVLKPLRVSEEKNIVLPMAEIAEQKRIIEPEYVELVNKILSDKSARTDQFGLESNLNLPAKNYAVKTGTSYDYHDSWTIGYTPDFVVGVWLGNSDNKPMHHISGSVGAGKIWNEIMGIMLNSSYNKRTPLRFEEITEFSHKNNLEYGLSGDNYEERKKLLKNSDLILEPHDFDTFQFAPDIKIPLRAREKVLWYVNNLLLGGDLEIAWQPKKTGNYIITAESLSGRKEIIKILVTEEER